MKQNWKGKEARAAELNVTRTYKPRSGKPVSDAGESELTERAPSADQIATATVCIGRTVQPAPYESLRIEVGGSMPCTPDDLADGTAHKRLIDVCRKELVEQLARGVDGLGGDDDGGRCYPKPTSKLVEAGSLCPTCDGQQYVDGESLVCSAGHLFLPMRRGGK